jgi:monovalent cation:H+ antiporter-2, CPA2 family
MRDVLTKIWIASIADRFSALNFFTTSPPLRTPLSHDFPLFGTVAVGLAYAWAFGFLAFRLGLPPLVGYLIAGIIVGPATPGFVADMTIAGQLADVGVVLLMFGVGMHFSLADLLAVKGIAIPGAIIQMLAATLMGWGLARFWGWPHGAGIVFGLALSVASTVVLLKTLEARGLLATHDGQITVGWLIVEDLVLIAILVLLPATAGLLGGKVPEGAEAAGSSILLTLAVTLGKVALFIVLMLVAAKRLFSWILKQVEKTNSKELFTLTVVTLSLGVAYAAYKVFGVKFALAAFFAGLVLHESDSSSRAEKELKPLQDVFTGLFFVSVGMLFDPSILLRQPLQVLMVVAIIVVGKSVAALALVLLLRKPLKTALIISASLAQIGEFSFILAGIGLTYGLLSQEAVSLVVAGALISITLNTFQFQLVEAISKRAGVK